MASMSALGGVSRCERLNLTTLGGTSRALRTGFGHVITCHYDEYDVIGHILPGMVRYFDLADIDRRLA